MGDWKIKNLPARCMCMSGVISAEVTFDVKLVTCISTMQQTLFGHNSDLETRPSAMNK